MDQLYYDAIDLLQKLISTPRVSRSETAAADTVEHFMRSNCCGEVSRLNNNVWCVAPGFDPERPTLLLNSHIDTVPAVEAWTRDPFDPAINADTGRLYGLGSNDAGASLVSLIAAFRALETTRQRYNLIMLASAEEEVSGKNGIEAALRRLPAAPSLAVVGEPTRMLPATSQRGLMVLDGETIGRAGHAARDEGVNAIYLAIEAIDRLRSLDIPAEDPTLGSVKISVTQIEAGTRHNIVPDHCRFVVDVRTIDHQSNLPTLEKIKQAVGSTASLTPRSTRLQPSAIAPTHPLVERLKIMGRDPFHSTTLSDSALIACPALKIGPGESARSHTADEFIYLDEIREAIEIYVKILSGLEI